MSVQRVARLEPRIPMQQPRWQKKARALRSKMLDAEEHALANAAWWVFWEPPPSASQREQPGDEGMSPR